MATEARHVVVRGLVQGVAFRHHTKLRARELGLAGWVRNLPNGTVEVRAEGDATALDQLEEFLRRGPPAARVDGMDVRPVAPESAGEGFRVLRP